MTNALAAAPERSESGSSHSVIPALLICAAAVLSPALLHAADPPTTASRLDQLLATLPEDYEKQVTLLQKQVNSFQASQQRAKTDLGRLVDNYRKAVLSRIGAANGALQLQSLGIVDQWLINGGPVPDCEMMLEDFARYYRTLMNAKAPVLRTGANLAAELKEKGELQKAEALEAELLALGEVGEATAAFKNGSDFTGERAVSATDKIIFRLKIENVTGDRFTGILEPKHIYKGHPTHESDGVLSGLNIAFKTGNIRQKDVYEDGRYVYEGTLVGSYIWGKYSGPDNEGRPRNGIFLLKLK